MSITVEIMPILWLLWIVVGVVFIIIGVIRLGTHQESDDHYVALNEQKNTMQLEELFSYFLEEEEKKNQGFRDLVVDIVKQQEHTPEKNVSEIGRAHV